MSPKGSFGAVLKTRVREYLRTTGNGDGPTPACVRLFFCDALWVVCLPCAHGGPWLRRNGGADGRLRRDPCGLRPQLGAPAKVPRLGVGARPRGPQRRHVVYGPFIDASHVHEPTRRQPLYDPRALSCDQSNKDGPVGAARDHAIRRAAALYHRILCRLPRLHRPHPLHAMRRAGPRGPRSEDPP